MFDKIKQLAQMRKQAEAIKKELDATNVDCEDVSGIKFTINGSQRFQAVQIDEDLLKPENKGKLEKDLLDGINAAIKKSQDLATEKMRGMMPDLPPS